MRATRWVVRLFLVSIVLFGAVLGLGRTPDQAFALTITVDSNGDGAGSCPGSPCTLRGAITLANANPGSTVNFSISGGGVHTITPASALPNITQATTIDGTSQPGYAGVPMIEISGVSVVGAGLRVNGTGGVTIKGLTINGFGSLNTGHGIALVAGGGNTIVSNYIGTNSTGSGAAGNWSGVAVSTSGNVIGGTTASERNVISGNTGPGIYILGGTGNVVRGNYVGLGADGSTAIGNCCGIAIFNGTSSNTIGGGGPGGANYISSNTSDGVSLGLAVSANSIIGNYIGVAADGTTARGNGGSGIFVGWASSTVIGRITTGDGNVIANNIGPGVTITDAAGGPANDNTVRGNYIYANGTPGIDLVGAGNNSIAAPTIVGPLPPHGTACANCTVDLYSDAGGQGRYYEGTVTADGAGNWAFYGTVTGANLTATNTDASGDTSEFSSSFAVAPCSGICTAGLWKLDFIDTSPPVFNHYCTASVAQSGATTSWGQFSCQDGLLEVFSATLTPNPDPTPDNNTSSGSNVSSTGLAATSVGTYSDDGNSASGTWVCTIGCTDSGTWTGTRLGATVSIPIGGGTASLGTGVPAATITTPPGSPAITVQAVPLENVVGGFLRTGYDFQPHGLTFDPSNPVRMQVTYNPTTDLPAGADCRDLAQYRYDPLTGVSTFQSRVGCSTNNSFSVPITGFSVHRFEIGRDTDSDGVDDGPDVCPLVADPGQEHSDAQILVLPGPDDWTVPYGDDSGDACDTDGDKDNDGLTDSQEAVGCGFGPTSPTNRDTDGDLFIDSAECALNKNPNSISIKPLLTQCGPSGDADGDGLLNQVEYCKYGTDPNNANSDRQHFNISDDTCDDGREAATVNANYTVDVLDLAAVAAQAGTYTLPATPTKLDVDFNRNGSIDVLDLGAVAAKATPSGFKCQLWPTLP